MLIDKADLKQIYQLLFKDGVMVAKKDYNAKGHPELPKVRNLAVIKALQSLESRGHVKSQFSWQYFYYFLTDQGILFLREYLHLPAEIVPATFKKSASTGVRPGTERRERREPRGEDGGATYRRRAAPDADVKKDAVAPGAFKPEFRQ